MFIILVFCRQGKRISGIFGGKIRDRIAHIVEGVGVEMFLPIQNLSGLDHIAVPVGILGGDHGGCGAVTHHGFGHLLILTVLRRVVIGVEGLGKNGLALRLGLKKPLWTFVAQGQ